MDYCNLTCNSGYLFIGDGTVVGANCKIAACRGVIDIRDNVLFAPNVFISDVIHIYNDINVPIKDQGLLYNKRQDNLPNILIEEGTWLGVNTVIVGNVHIGKNCVVGSNSVVKTDISDYSVAVGIPAKVIKKYDKNIGKWIKVKKYENNCS